jgi:uncharacterized membrane protein
MQPGNAEDGRIVETDEGAERQMISSPEGWIFVAGGALIFLYLCAVGITWLRAPATGHDLLLMTSSHVLGGRAAGMSYGYTQGYSPSIVILVNAVIETFMVLLVYPLFVFSYKKLFIIKPLENTLQRTERAARRMQPKVMRWGIPGLLVFVWFPFWMTGPVVGCIIGFLIGLRPWVNMAVVIAGTYLAILSWGLVLKQVHEVLRQIGPYVPFVFVGIILLLAIALHVRHALGDGLANENEQRGDEEGGDEKIRNEE